MELDQIQMFHLCQRSNLTLKLCTRMLIIYTLHRKTTKWNRNPILQTKSQFSPEGQESIILLNLLSTFNSNNGSIFESALIDSSKSSLSNLERRGEVPSCRVDFLHGDLHAARLISSSCWIVWTHIQTLTWTSPSFSANSWSWTIRYYWKLTNQSYILLYCN